MIKYVLKKILLSSISIEKYPDSMSIVMNDIFFAAETAFRRVFCSLCKNDEKQ